MLALTVSALSACRNGAPADDPPVAQSTTLQTAEDTRLEVHLPACCNPGLSYSIIDAPDHGTLGEISADGVVTYMPGAGFSGRDEFVFRATDDQDRSAQATVAIIITPGNDAPTISPVAHQSIPAGGSTGALAFTVGDADSAADSLTVTATSSNTALVPNDPANLVLGGSGANRTLDVIPAAGASGTTTITLSVSDGSATASTTFMVDVTELSRLFWMTTGGSLRRVAVDGSNPSELRSGISGAFAIAIDPVTQALFYNRGSAVVRADSDGANPVDIVANGGAPYGLAVDSTRRKVYWSDFNGNRVMVAELDGSNPTLVLGGINSPSGLAIDEPNGKVYLITYNSTQLLRFDLDGSNLETIDASPGGQGVGVAVDSSGGKVYYSTRGAHIYVANLDGSNRTTVVTGQGSVQGIAIDVAKGDLYWSDPMAGMIRTARLADGSGIRDVTSSGGNGWSMALMPAR
ncbi:Ig-like domain-containing protein [Archangium violaceum]|uniref:Ig-like domain-containing protein n=1 Tax=Archangium violaceum TaxID=83451 RepID=UPI001F3F932E|nr:Ig-like domain-containing protein [Archangium violaceum]